MSEAQHTNAPEENAPEAAASPEAAPTAQVEALTAEVDQLKDQLLRALAEAENTRRRLQKEVEDARKYAVSGFAKELLPVADNFRRALDAIPKDATDGEVLKNLIAGIEATERQLLASFERFGIKPLNPQGQPFDPHFHRVMLEQEDASLPAGTVTQVLQCGYMIQDRLLREALVAVSKGGPVAHKVDQSA